MAIRIERDEFVGTLKWNDPIPPAIRAVTTPLQDESILLDPAMGCHVDHEGFDLNQLEQHYYTAHGVGLVHDPTLYKDGAGVKGTYAIIQPWCEQFEYSDYKLIIDHSHFVYRFPIEGLAALQIKRNAVKRPELLRMLSAGFKCGLDLCIDILDDSGVQTVVHIEWDYDDFETMRIASEKIRNACIHMDWDKMVPAIQFYNKLAESLRIDAFTRANTRSQLLFGRNSYMLVPTL